MASTNQYYSLNAEEFITSTLNLDMSELYNRFEKYLNRNDKILDIGCGPGRDLKYFSTNYYVEGVEPSQVFADYAKNYSGAIVFEGDFENYKSELNFNGVWACASLLHISSETLPVIFKKIDKLLLSNGVVYCSFKYGEFEGERNNRFFVDLTEIKLAKLISSTQLDFVEYWITEDLRPGRSSEKWLNAILKKK